MSQASSPADVVHLGSRVTIKDKSSGRQDDFVLVPSAEAKPSDGKLSYDSPLARALVGARTGNTIVVHTPRGERSVELLALA
jgi:transcription elongation factor GreA